MAIGEFLQQAATTILLFKADVSDAKRGLKELTGEERKAAEAAVKISEERNKAYDRIAKGITATTVAMKLGKEAVDLFGDAWKSYETAALKAGGADAEKARAFRSALNTFDSSMDKIKQSIGGIVASLAPLVELAGTIIGYAADAIGVVGDMVGSIVDPSSDQVGSWLPADSEQGKLYRKLISKKNPYLLDATRATELAKVAQALAASGLVTASAISTQRYAEGVAGNTRLDPMQASLLDALGILAPEIGGSFRGTGQGAFRDLLRRGGRAPDKTRGGRGSRVGPTTYETESRRYDPGYLDQTLGAAGTDYGTGAGPARYGMDQFDYGAFGREAAASLDAFRKQTMLEQIFGAPETFDLYQSKLELLKGGLDIFTGALQSHFDAWVSGSETLSQAVAGMGRDIVTGIASQLQAYAIKEGVLALISLAAGDVRGAAQHGIAAGAAEAGAVSVGAIARHFNMSAGGGGGGGGYGGAPAAGTYGNISGGSGIGGGDGKSTVIYVGDYWTENPREQRQKAGRAIKAARRELESYEGVRDA